LHVSVCRCPHRDINNLECETRNIRDSTIEEECHCESECEIEANNVAFGDPCYGTYKYLNITFICVRNDGK